jgi:hypothetical protein
LAGVWQGSDQEEMVEALATDQLQYNALAECLELKSRTAIAVSLGFIKGIRVRSEIVVWLYFDRLIVRDPPLQHLFILYCTRALLSDLAPCRSWALILATSTPSLRLHARVALRSLPMSTPTVSHRMFSQDQQR